MIRGTTAPFKIKLPYTIGELEWVTIKWWQDGNNGTTMAPLPITKRLAHCSVSNIYICKLSSGIAAGQYYFTIDSVMYGFDVSSKIEADLLEYNTTTKNLTVGDVIISPEVIESNEDMTELIFINETNNSNELHVSLTANETMRFSERHKAKMQFRAMLKSNGKVISCKPKLITVYPINDALLEDDIVIDTIFDDVWAVLDGQNITQYDALVVLNGQGIAK